MTRAAEQSDPITLPCPPGRPCGELWCGDMAVHGQTRCERHLHPVPTWERGAIKEWRKP